MRELVSGLVWFFFEGGWLKWMWLGGVVVAVGVLSFVRTFLSLLYILWPFPCLLDALYRHSNTLRQLFSLHFEGEKSCDIQSLVSQAGYRAEEHLVETQDGFILCMFRITKPQQQQQQVQQQHHRYLSRPPVLCMHGLLMSADVWLLAGKSALPYALCDAGYDVWLGNNRGNKYSCKHRSLDPRHEAFWNWSLDELARYDVPAMIHKIQHVTGRKDVAYLGFSQGTAQGFAALTLNPALEAQVPIVVALAPAVAVCRLRSNLVSAIVRASPAFIFLLFGRRCFLPCIPTWQSILSRQAYSKLIELILHQLFHWTTHEIDISMKPRFFHSLYSPTSVKTLVHWFQIITQEQGLGVYDDLGSEQHSWWWSGVRANFRTARYDFARLRVPCALFYGKADTLVSIPKLEQLFCHETAMHHVEETYEHLDFLWATSCPSRVFPKVLAALAMYHPVSPHHHIPNSSHQHSKQVAKSNNNINNSNHTNNSPCHQRRVDTRFKALGLCVLEPPCVGVVAAPSPLSSSNTPLSDSATTSSDESSTMCLSPVSSFGTLLSIT